MMNSTTTFTQGHSKSIQATENLAVFVTDFTKPMKILCCSVHISVSD